MTRGFRHVALLPPLLACFGPACLRPKVGKDPTPSRTYAEFDPAAAKPLVPAPTDLAIDPVTGLVAIPPELAETDAERQLAAYLAQLDGYPPESPAYLTFSGEIDKASLLASIEFFDLTTSKPGKTISADFVAAWDAAPRRVTLSPKSALLPGHTYGIVVRSGDRAGIRDAAGRKVWASPAFFMVRGDASLVTCPRDLENPNCQSATDLIPARSTDPVEARKERRDAALRLERMRLALVPVFSLAEERGIPREEIVLAWTFRVSTMPTARFDIEGKSEVPIPFPNDIFLVDGRIEIPAPEGQEPEPIRFLRESLRKLDGFSTTAPIRVGVDLPAIPGTDGAPATAQELDPTTLTPDNFRIAPLKPGEPAENYAVAWEPESRSLLARPHRPLTSRTLYLGTVGNGVATLDGRPLRASFSMAVLRMTAPVAVNGVSQIRGLSDELATQAEMGRMALAPAWVLAELALKKPRSELASLFAFTTQTVTEPLPELRALPSRLGTATAVSATLKVPDPFFAYKYVDSLVEGEMETPVLLQTATLEGFPTPLPEPVSSAKISIERVPYTITLPKCVPAGKTGSPVAIVIHGVYRWRRDLLLAADAFAERCIALAGIDLPYHGDRTVCLANADCEGGNCDGVTHRCQGSGLKLDPVDGNPFASGQAFVKLDNLFAVRDNMRQGVIDTAQLLRVLRAPDGPGATPGVRIDAGAPVIIGVSMGGMVATMALASMPEPHAGLLGFTGADVIDILFTSPLFRDALLTQLGNLDIEVGTPEFRMLDMVTRWVFDPAEPINYAAYVKQKAFSDVLGGGTVPAKRVILQMAGKDQVITNEFTRLLAELVGITPAELEQTTFPNADHLALFNPFDPDFPRIVRQAAKFVEADGTVIPPP